MCVFEEHGEAVLSRTCPPLPKSPGLACAFKRQAAGQAQWLMSVIPSTWETEAGQSRV